MTAYKGASRKIKDGLVQILGNITYDTGAGAEPAFTSVIGSSSDRFEGSPVAMVLPSALDSQASASAQFDHTNAFSVWVFLSITDATSVEDAVYCQMLDLVDLVVDTTEHDDYIGTLSIIDPTFQNWIMNISHTRIYVTGDKGGGYLVADMNVTISYSKDVY